MAENLKEKLSQEKIAEICGYIRSGASFEVAILAAGLTESEGISFFEKLERPSGFFIEILDDCKFTFEVPI
jgi:hypothetical protein